MGACVLWAISVLAGLFVSLLNSCRAPASPAPGFAFLRAIAHAGPRILAVCHRAASDSRMPMRRLDSRKIGGPSLPAIKRVAVRRLSALSSAHCFRVRTRSGTRAGARGRGFDLDMVETGKQGAPGRKELYGSEVLFPKKTPTRGGSACLPVGRSPRGHRFLVAVLGETCLPEGASTTDNGLTAP